MKKIKKSTLLEPEPTLIYFNKNKLLRVRASEVFKIKHKIPKFTEQKPVKSVKSEAKKTKQSFEI